MEVRQLSASVTQRQLEAAVTALCADRRIDGVLVRVLCSRAAWQLQCELVWHACWWQTSQQWCHHLQARHAVPNSA